MRQLFLRLVNSRSVLSGALLYIGMRWFDRLAGVVSTIVLARLLTPADFGIVAIATIVLGMASVMLDFGIQFAVVQIRNLERADLDTAWTIRLLQNAVIAAILVLSSGWVADHYHDLRLAPVLVVLGVAYLIDGLTGMGPVVFQKRQQYALEVAFFMFRRAAGLVVTILLALWLRDYWALVIGTLLSNAIGVVLSYSMHPFAPRLTLARWRHFFGASIWLTLHSIAGYVSLQLDKLIVGRRDGAPMLGAYTLADQIAAMPTSELLAPMNRALFPAMAAVQDDLPQLRQMFLSGLGIQAMLAMPAAIGLALVAPDVVVVMLGQQWAAAGPVMTALALAYGVNSLTHSSIYLMNSLGRYRALALLRSSVVAGLALLAFVVYPASQAIDLAWFRAGLGGLTIGVVARLTMMSLPGLGVFDMVRAVGRPVVAAAMMAAAVAWIMSVAADLAAWQRLAVAVVGGACAYVACLGALWVLAGRPSGAEGWALAKARAALAAMRNS